MKSLLPKGHKEPPTIKNYMKFKEGENRFRILSEAITGYEYFSTEKKPIRSAKPFAEFPSDIKSGGKINYFWAFIVYNYQDAEIALEAGLPSDSAPDTRNHPKGH